MDIKGNFAANLKTIRLTKGLSLLEFADEIGISKSTLYKIEKGDVNPTLSLIDQVSDNLSIPAAELLLEPSYTPSELVVIKRLLSSIDLFTQLSEEKQKKVAALFIEIVKELSPVVPNTTGDGGSHDKT
jgi:transcriptional regulator with XRE-family HTH domain